MAIAPFIFPVPSTDSRFHTDQTGLTIQRAPGSRLAAYFRLDPRVASRNHGHRLQVKYVDEGSGEWCLEHLSRVRPTEEIYPWISAGRIRLEASGECRTVVFDLAQARWTGAGNRADFRIVGVGNEIRELRILSIRIGDDKDWGHDTEVLSSLTTPRHPQFAFPPESLDLEFPEIDDPEVSVVIPVFNKLDYTLDCLRALLEFTPPVYEVIVVDNGSTDATPEILAGLSGVCTISNPSNLGFAKACNQGGRRARGSWIVFLNNDTIPQPGWLNAMLASARADPRIGIVGCKLVFPQSGEVQCAGVSFGKRGLPVEDFRYADPHDPELSYDREVEAVSGACFLISQILFLDMGGFNEQFFNGYEDIDLCLRVKQAGKKNIYCAASTVLHYQSATELRLDPQNEKANVALFRKMRFPELIDAGGDSNRSIMYLRDLPMRLDAGSPDILNQTGDRVDGAIACMFDRHAAGHCVYGPFVETGEPIAAVVTFALKISNISTFDKILATLDIYDCVGDCILNTRAISVRDMIRASGRYGLNLESETGRILEFRVYWHARSDLHFFHIDLNPRIQQR